MLKKTGTLIAICCFFIAALPGTAPAAQSVSRQSLVKKNIAVLQSKLQASAAEDSTPLHALTIEFLENLQKYGFGKNPANLQLAVSQYVSDIQEQAEAAALDPACVTPLLYYIAVNGSSMLQEVVSADPPVCQAIRLSESAASIIQAQYAYDVCSDPTLAADRAPKQKALQYFSFAASALNMFICSPTISVSSYVSLLYNFIMLFVFT
jgi:hypothetical protein